VLLRLVATPTSLATSAFAYSVVGTRSRADGLGYVSSSRYLSGNGSNLMILDRILIMLKNVTIQ